MLIKIIKNWGVEEDGVTAIEFSMLALPFFLLIFGIIEIALMYAAGSMVEFATDKSARLIRTGQLQQTYANDTEAAARAFRDRFCDYSSVVVDCEQAGIEVVRLDNFSDFGDYQAEFNEDGDFESRGFSMGAENDKVLVRVVYIYNYMTPFIGNLLGGPSARRTFVSTIVLQTEPYQF